MTPCKTGLKSRTNWDQRNGRARTGSGVLTGICVTNSWQLCHSFRLLSHDRVVLPRLFPLLTTFTLALAQTVAAQTPTPPQPDLINADRPGIADGSGAIDRGTVQVEFGLQQQFLHASGSQQRSEFLPTLFRLGLGDHIEARVETSLYIWTRITPASGPASTADGFSPTTIGMKYNFSGAGTSPQRSFGVILRVAPPSGSGIDATHRATADLRLAADWDLPKKLSLNPNIGVARYAGDSNRDFTTALMALTLSWWPTTTVNPFVDAGYQASNGPGQSGVLTIDGGIAYIISRNVQLDVSAGAGPGAAAPRPFWAVGISVRKPRR
jgi:hypothetical protein